MTETGKISPEKALRVRQRVKRRKPNFVRPESWRYVRIKQNWRNPKGLDHKVRLMYKGWPPAAGSGYGGPKTSRHLHPSGYKEVLVYNLEDLSKIDPDTQAARIGHRVGRRKKAGILVEARKKKIVVLNLREIKESAEEKPSEEKTEEKVEETKKKAEEKELKETGKKEKEEPKKRGRRTDKQ